eukprot:13084860-Alexandrium_andersonii.AAC.1
MSCDVESAMPRSAAHRSVDACPNELPQDPGPKARATTPRQQREGVASQGETPASIDRVLL